MANTTTVVIGAGPYGLSISSHLKAQNIPFQIFGKPMEFWQKMPPDMYLKSSWSSLTVSDPAHTYTLNRFSKLHNIPRQEPVPLQVFLKYTHWYRQQAVPDIDETYVEALAPDGKNFHLALADGRTVKANRVVVASGIAPFAYIPDFARQLPAGLVSHTQQHTDFTDFKGKHVVVVGGGQSAFEAAALLFEAEAEVELIVRGPVIWIDRRLYRYTSFAKRVFYPPSDIGPAGISWIVAFPLLFRRFPDKVRTAIDTRSVRPAAAPWIRPRVEGRFRITPHTEIVSATEKGEGVCLKLSDGSTREVDHVILGTGYKPDIQALGYIDPLLRKQVREHGGYPLLNKWFESSVPHLYFVGSLAGYTFGPLCRFVTGAGVPARQITRHVSLGI
ncbi:MAG TPA: NAD(P)-binding domain-containing protein [Ktedonobacteraceae bacterium]|nr:NAD(P)-binding domain-containing protein [Ktedonobacteraceae bacterium]